MLSPHGIHHLTAVTANARGNLAFYTRTLGLRLVKKTVNQDDVRAYHLFYADEVGSPGTDLTFFDWPARRETRGNHAVTRTGLRVPAASLAWWQTYLREAGVTLGEGVVERGGRAVLDFEDPEGQRLSLVADEEIADEGTGAGMSPHPVMGASVPAEQQILGLGPITLSVPGLFPTDQVLERAYGMQRALEYTGAEGETVHVFQMAAPGPQGELHVAVRPSLPPHQPGAGGVHHVAFRVRDGELSAWQEQLSARGLRTSGEVERYYFKSIYYREPNGVLLELATDGPGFTADEPSTALGERLALPPFLEGRRAEIEAGLKPL